MTAPLPYLYRDRPLDRRAVTRMDWHGTDLVAAIRLAKAGYEVRLRNGRPVEADDCLPPSPCRIEGCRGVSHRDGLCRGHWETKLTMKNVDADGHDAEAE